MASSSSSSQFSPAAAESDVGVRRPPPPQRKPPYMLLLPLIYAPVLPLIRIGLRHNPVWRDRLFYGVLAGAFAHGTYLMTGWPPTMLAFSLGNPNDLCVKPIRCDSFRKRLLLDGHSTWIGTIRH